MIRGTWRRLRDILPTRARGGALVIAVGSVIVGMLEAGLLILVVTVALSIAEGGDSVQLGVPIAGQLELEPATALGAAAVAGVAMLSIHLGLAWVTARLSAVALRATRDRAVRAFARASWAKQAEDREGALQETSSTLALQTASLITHLSNFAAAAVGLSVLLLAALLVDPLVTIVVLIAGTFLFLLLRPIGRLTRVRSTEHVTTNSRFNERVSQWSSLAMEIRVFGVEEAELQRLGEHSRAAERTMARSRFASRAGAELYRDLAILFLVSAVAALYLVDDVDLASVGAVVLLIVRSLSYAQQTNSAMQIINEVGPNLETLINRLEPLEEAAETPGDRPLDVISSIELRDVGYDYAPGRPGIDGVTVTLGRGDALGVIGPSGGGKSTLVQVLLRLRPPSRGEVLVSDLAYREIASESWHRLVALVPQEPKLFQGTVAENISFLRAGISSVMIEQAAADAHVLDDIKRLPRGFDTVLGPRGAGLSGGQKQRVAIARALVGKPQLLVLDEPTSALDVRSEQLLQETIESLKGQVTLVIVAHRLTTLACCDRVMAMEDGRVKAIGTLDEVLPTVSLTDALGSDTAT